MVFFSLSHIKGMLVPYVARITTNNRMGDNWRATEPLSVSGIREVKMEYLSARQTAEKWGISIQRIQVICKTGRIPGAFIVGNSWAIPADAVKPRDKRIKSGKYINKYNSLAEMCNHYCITSNISPGVILPLF